MLNKIVTTLRKANLNDVDKIFEWSGNPEFVGNVIDLPSDPKERRFRVIAMIEASTAEPSSDIIIMVEADKPIGLLIFNRIDTRNGTAYLSMLIGNDESKNKTYGAKMLLDAFDFSFNYLNLHTLLGCVYSHNDRMINLLEHFGANKEGIIKDQLIKDGKKTATVIYALFKSDYSLLIESLKEKGLITT